MFAFVFFVVLISAAHETALGQGTTCPDLAVTAFTAQKVAPDKIRFFGTAKNIGSMDFVPFVYVRGDAELQILAYFPSKQERRMGSWDIVTLRMGEEYSPSPAVSWPLVFTPAMAEKPAEIRLRIAYRAPNVPDCSKANNEKVISYGTIEQIMMGPITKDPTPPTLSALSISPNVLPATGGDVVFNVTASDNKGVTVVNAVVGGSGWAMTVPLKRVSGNEKSGVWQGTYKAPANTTSQDVSYTVNCNAWDSDGNKSYSYKGGPVFVVKGTPTQYKYKK
jgi:hypothetical protein